MLSATPLLEIRDLSLGYPGGGPAVLRGVNLAVHSGQAVGVRGPSGGGKTTLARAILGFLRPPGAIVSGSIRVGENHVLRDRPTFRGSIVSMIPQDASAALSPVRTIEAQVAEVLRAHRPLSWSAAKAASRDCLRTLFGEETERIASSYPHQLSGGQKQRAVIAQAICVEPRLLIADEPASTLDSVTQYETLVLLRTLHRKQGMGILMFGHDTPALSFLASRIHELRDGTIAA